MVERRRSQCATVRYACGEKCFENAEGTRVAMCNRVEDIGCRARWKEVEAIDMQYEEKKTYRLLCLLLFIYLMHQTEIVRRAHGLYDRYLGVMNEFLTG